MFVLTRDWGTSTPFGEFVDSLSRAACWAKILDDEVVSGDSDKTGGLMVGVNLVPGSAIAAPRRYHVGATRGRGKTHTSNVGVERGGGKMRTGIAVVGLGRRGVGMPSYQCFTSPLHLGGFHPSAVQGNLPLRTRGGAIAVPRHSHSTAMSLPW